MKKACEGNAAPDQIALPDPIEMKPELAQMQKDDRAYQEASVAFYGQDKTKAVQLFKTIAASSSPPKAAARYNVANLLANAKNLSEARAEAAAIIADPSLSSVHVITKELQGYIANLEDTPEGWFYTGQTKRGTVRYRPALIEYLAANAGLKSARLPWKHPRQTWWLLGFDLPGENELDLLVGRLP